VFSFQDSRGPVSVAFTDRHPGEGFAGGALDLAEPRGLRADPASEHAVLAENLDVLARALAQGGLSDDAALAPGAGPPTVVRMHQVHGGDVHTVDRDWLAAGHAEPPTADGLVTDLPGVALLVRAADCVPVLLADPERRVVAAAHAGRKGLVARVVPNTIARMRELGAERVTAWVGPSICGHCYEVPADLRDQVVAAVPEAYAETSWGTPGIDVAAGVLAQLASAEVEVVDASTCTLENDDLYSYRRDGAAAGRLGGFVWVRP
jgi:YfiH family protein